MPFVQIGRNRVNYGLQGNPDGEVIVFLNGLTQTNSLWTHHRERLSKQGYRVLTYDMLGQGLSSKPVLGIRLEDHAKLLCQLLDALEIKRCYLAGISYGGVVALHTTIHYPERVKGLIAMSTFCEMPGQLEMLGRVFHMAITQAGFPLIQAMLLPMNFSSKWIDQIRGNLPEHLRRGYVINDPYAIQNLMESYVNFQPFTQDLAKIQCPTLILNGEFDFLTPRLCHETLRQHIESSRLMIVPQAFHAFTLEYPEITVRVLEAFVRSVEEGSWKGDKSVWVASEDPQSEVLATRCVGDHMRAVFVSPTGDQPPAEEWRSPVPRDSDDPKAAKPPQPLKPAPTRNAAATKPKLAASKAPAKPAKAKPAKMAAKPATPKAAAKPAKTASAKTAAVKTTPKAAPAKPASAKAAPVKVVAPKGTASKTVAAAPTAAATPSITATIAAAAKAKAKPTRVKSAAKAVTTTTPTKPFAPAAAKAKPTTAAATGKSTAKAAVAGHARTAKSAKPATSAAPKPARPAKAAPAAKTRGSKAASLAKG